MPTPNPASKPRRSNGTQGSKYLVHLVRAENNARTVCGRLSATVNHSYDASPREELCRACGKRPESAVTEASR